VTALLGIALSAAVGAATPIDSRVDRVTVYPESLATVERVATVELPARTGTLTLAGLPTALNPSSVRVDVTNGDLTLGRIETATVAMGEPSRERERALRDKRDQLQDERARWADKQSTARTELDYIKGLSRLPSGEGAVKVLSQGDDATQRWRQLQELIATSSQQAHRRLREAEREVSRLDQAIETVERRLDQLGDSEREAVRVSIPYQAATKGEATLRLSYRVDGPSWRPHYETRLDTQANTLRLIRYAEVSQATGEDWADVSLRLATTRPVTGERPEPGTWWVDLYKKSDGRAGSGAQGKRQHVTEQLARLAADSAGAPRPEVETVNAEFAATYEIPGRVSIPADNQPQSLRIKAHGIDAAIEAQVFPQQEPRAWLVARATWTGQGPLPAGRVARFRDGAYVGEGQLGTWAPGEERSLTFGTDPRVTVRFEAARDEAGESGWITTQSTRRRLYQLTVDNQHTVQLPVTVFFRVPVGRDDGIEVSEQFSRQPDTRDWEDKQGVHVWRLPLKAGGKGRLSLGFEVSYPQDKDLSGL
jgi:uncharacterized protein (TIGR02231 family)